ncbi:MAG: hypothetical protein HOV80_27280 [Polyangiaceae bacterium]|nr:hypothetical protein [Polyangiaceae bacterium]
MNRPIKEILRLLWKVLREYAWKFLKPYIGKLILVFFAFIAFLGVLTLLVMSAC